MAQQREGRHWTVEQRDFVDADGYADEDAFRAKVELELARLENMLFRLGRGFMVAPIRVRHEDRGVVSYETVGVVIEETFMPAVRAPEPEPAEEPVEDEELEAMAGVAGTE